MFRTGLTGPLLTRRMENLIESRDLELLDASEPLAPSEHGARERWRKPASLIAILSVAAAAPFVPSSESIAVRLGESCAGLGLVAAAVLGRLWCAVYIAGRKNAELCTVGPYSILRHPLYVFSSLGVLGVLVSAHRSALAAAGFAGFWVYYSFVMREEDARLARMFGQEFASYRRHVSRVWPRFRAFRDMPAVNVATAPLGRTFLDVAWFFGAWMVVFLLSA